MHNAHDSLKAAAEKALATLTGDSPKARVEAARQLSEALAENSWIPVTALSMPPERIRVIASFGTCVIPDCFYGHASRARTEVDGRKLWRETHSEEPLAFVPTSWMPQAAIPAAPPEGKGKAVVAQDTQQEEPPEDGTCSLCGRSMHIQVGDEPTEICHECAQSEVTRLLAPHTLRGRVKPSDEH